MLVQRHYLRTYGGGFTENFYGLKRERVLRIEGGEAARTQAAAPDLMRRALKLSNADVWKNLAIMVGIPYVKRKLDEAYEVHAPQVDLLGPQHGRDRLPADATWRQRVMHYYKWFLRRVYPGLNAAYYFALLGFNLAYLFSNTAYSSPFLWLVQTRIRRLNGADAAAIEALTNPKPDAGSPASRPGQSNSIWNPRTFTTVLLPRLLSSLRILLPTSIFALKFLEWWHASDFARQLSRKAAEGLELPPPVTAGLADPVKKPAKAPGSDSPSPRRSALKQRSSVSLANRPSTPPGGKDASPGSPPTSPSKTKKAGFSAPISISTGLPILTVPRPTASTSSMCPICVKAIVTPTACQTGFVFCYTCIFRWVDGSHERQEAWMRGEGGEEGWGEDDEELERAARQAAGVGADEEEGGEDGREKGQQKGLRSRVGRWESGKERCAVTGRRVLGGTEGLRRIMV